MLIQFYRFVQFDFGLLKVRGPVNLNSCLRCDPEMPK